MSNRKFPKMLNEELERSLNRIAKRLVADWEESVNPLLYKFGILDDTHIKRYLLKANTLEDIYKDAIAEKPEVIKSMELEELYDKNADVWCKLRNYNSPVKSPKEEGFIFCAMPGSDISHKGIIEKALSVDNCKILIDEEFLHQVSIMKPTEKQIEVYNLLADFCEKWEKLNLKNVNILTLFATVNGKVSPNVRRILGNDWLVEIK